MIAAANRAINLEGLPEHPNLPVNVAQTPEYDREIVERRRDRAAFAAAESSSQFKPQRPPGEGVRFRIIEAQTLTGDFDSVNLPTPPEGDKSVYIRGHDFVEILSTNIADFDEDGFLTIFDFLLFGNLWSQNDPRADLDQSTGVGVFDIFDFIAFGNLFSRG